MLGIELGVMDITDAEYMHLQNLIQVHMEAQAGAADAGSHPATEFATATSTQAVDLSSSTEEHCQEMLGYGEKTPDSYGDVPGYVLARVRGDGRVTSSNSRATSQTQSRAAARVCLEKTFNAVSADMPGQQDLQSSVLKNFLATLQQTTDAQDEVIHAQMQKCTKTDKENSFEVSSPCLGDVFNPTTSMCGQVLGHIPYIIEPSKHQGFFVPKSIFNFHPERIAIKAHYISSSSSTEEQQLVDLQSNVAPPAASRKHSHNHNSQHTKAAEAGSRTPSCVSFNQRRERHNGKERERRKRIRLSCDELNMLVPFCNTDTDKVTTLQWTTAYLRYINKTHGDTFKVEFEKSLTVEKDCFSNPTFL